MRRRGRSRQTYDPLEPIEQPTWLVVRDEVAAVLESHELPARADLRLVFVCAALRRITLGWRVEDMSPGISVFFCSRAGRRECVGISRRDPFGPWVDEGRVSLGTWPLVPDEGQ